MGSHQAPTLGLAQHFLISMPGMQDDAFAHSVVYVCEHGAHGALGLCINKPLDMSLETLLGQLSLPLGRADLQAARVGWGGPVQVERGFVLHPRMEHAQTRRALYTSSLDLPDGLQMTTSRDVLEAIARGEGPAKLRVVLGYAAWDAGQLEAELRRNSWLTVPAEHGVLFDVPVQECYEAAMALLGIQPSALSSDFGRA